MCARFITALFSCPDAPHHWPTALPPLDHNLPSLRSSHTLSIVPASHPLSRTALSFTLPPQRSFPRHTRFKRPPPFYLGLHDHLQGHMRQRLVARCRPGDVFVPGDQPDGAQHVQLLGMGAERGRRSSRPQRRGAMEGRLKTGVAPSSIMPTTTTPTTAPVSASVPPVSVRPAASLIPRPHYYVHL